METIKVQAMEQPKTWRLVCDGGGSENEEVVFSVQGSILQKDLPPFLGKPPSVRSKIKYLRQNITLSGLGTPTFRDAMRSTGEIFGLFDRQFNEGFLQPWVATMDPSGGEDLLEASNRYLTPKRDASAASAVEFDHEVDPKGTLQAMAGNDHFHTDDNVVLYYKRRTEDDGRYSYQKIGPQSFRTGDIVEIQVSFVVVPLKGEKYKMISVLRSIAFIDGNFKQVSQAIFTETKR
ncbi:hypothetical protein FPV67DRAFT_1407739 [Lyophyllum atratum]|nr:hypothetical protein FPV67DRAFT_1407739 [Lyophyllum atratum]